MNPKTCPTCQAPIPADAPGGLCPACVLRDAEEIPVAGRGAPTLAEIAAAFPQWEILGLLGRGGMGCVYRVRQPALDRIVALKILDPDLGRDPAFAERFAREARTLGKLQHPNIVTVFEHGEAGGFFYLVMEHVDGVNLRQAMQAGRFTPEQALAIVPGICDALQAAHARGVWHRDIKPENILLDKDGRVKIADFGIARTGHALGSAAYMAPEQLEKPHHVDHRADIYSLGVVIYEMLTGELPLGRFPLPSQRAEVGKRIDEIVLRTLEKERELRQQSASEVKTEVEGAKVAPVPAKRSVPKAVFIGCAALVLLGLLLIGVPLVLWFGLRPKSVQAAEDMRRRQMEERAELVEANAAKTKQDPEAVDGNAIQGASANNMVKREPRPKVTPPPQPPSLEAALPASAPFAESVIEVLSDGSFRLDGVVMDIEKLRQELITVAGKTESRPVRIRGYESAPYQRIVKVMEICQQAGIWNLSFDHAGRESVEKDGKPEDSPEIAMKEFLLAAKVGNKAAMKARSSRSLIALVDDDGELLRPFRKLDRMRFVEAKQADDKTAEVVLETTEGLKQSFTFRMVLEDGRWKLTEYGR